ncbi:MAG: PaaI family thioesterase [Acidimicrobiales bacterium]
MPEELLPPSEARLAAARELRRLAALLVGSERTEAEWAELAAVLAEAAPGEHAGEAPSAYAAHVDASPPGASTYERHPLTLGTSAAFPEVELVLEDDHQVVLGLAFGAAWEGPAGLAHGGFVAAAFDIACSRVASAHLGACVTRHLRLRYLRPTPLHRRLELRAVRGEREGRLLQVEAVLSLDGRATTKAVAEFASLGG